MFTDPVKNLESFGLAPGMKVADMGSGSGFYSIESAKRIGDSGKVFAIDVQKELLAKLKNDAEREGLSNIEYIWGDIEENGGTRLDDNSVDVVLLSNTMFQLENKESTLHEAMRVLKPKGQILIIDWTDSFGGLGPDPMSVYTEDSARRDCQKLGMNFMRKFDAGEHHYGLVYTK